MSRGPVDPRDPHVSAAALHEARSGLLRAARAAQGAWLLALGSTMLLVLLAAGLFAVSLFVSPTYVLIWTVLLSAAVANVTRYWPQRADRPGVALDDQEVRALRQELDPHAPDFPHAVRLVPEPVVQVSAGRLVLGMPLLACLAAEDLRRLVAVAGREASSAGEDGVVRRVITLVDGDLGRGWHLRRRATSRARGLTGRINAALTGFAEERERWRQAFRANAELSSRRDALALHHHDLVVEGWQLMRQEWLDPSLERGCWHPEPFTSLRSFLAGAQAAGILDGVLPARPDRGALVDLVTDHEAEVADIMLGERVGDELRSISWADHPAMVTVPHWRAVVMEALDVSRELTGQTTPATVEGVLGLVESGDLVAVARRVAPDHGLDHDRTDWVTMSRWVGGYPALLLVSVVGMAAVDSGRFRLRWSWPDGTSLVDDDGWVLPLHQVAEEVLRPKVRTGVPAIVELGMALGELGIDIGEPLWLTRAAPGAPTTTERPTGSFIAYEGLGSRQVIVTDRAMHVFGRPWSAGLRDHYAMRMRGADELRTRMLRVWQGDETDQTAYVATDDVVRARFGLLTGGSRWRLVVRTHDGTVTLRGLGDAAGPEAVLADWLGDRLTTSWLHVRPGLLRVRNTIGRLGLGIALPAFVAALLLTVVDPPAVSRVTAPLLALAGVGALVLAVLPDVVMEVVWRIWGHPERPEIPVVVRRYARPTTSDAPPGAPSWLERLDRSAATDPHRDAAADHASHADPSHAESSDTDPVWGGSAVPTGSAMQSITLDLGDLPEESFWPDRIVSLDEIEDLGDLSDLPDYPRVESEQSDHPDWPDWPEELAPLPRS